MGPIDPVEQVVLFDGVCNLCSAAVQFIISHNSKRNLRFASLQSDFGKSQQKCFEGGFQMDTIIFLRGDTTFFKSDAALEICGELDGLYPVLKVYKVIPRPFRDWIYDLIAANRYRWFGKKNECWIPTADLQSRFIS